MIEIRDLYFSYSNRQKLINKLNLTLETGNIYGLLGKNGAGKTTLLKLICGILFAENGTCTINGIKSSDRLPEALANIYFIPEEFKLTSKTARDMARQQKVFYTSFDEQQYFDYLSNFGINPDSLIKNLSFGQKKQVLISFGLATNTKYLLLDEPTNGLDIPSKRILRKMLASAISNERSFIISTHQIRDLENMIDPIIIINNGEVVFNETHDQIANKLTFKTLSNIESDEVIWSEKKLLDYNTICLNTQNEFTNTNLETLFTAITENTEAFTKIFSKQS